jgi:hypothetical protein
LCRVSTISGEAIKVALSDFFNVTRTIQFV